MLNRFFLITGWSQRLEWSGGFDLALCVRRKWPPAAGAKIQTFETFDHWANGKCYVEKKNQEDLKNITFLSVSMCFL